jgi:hypothetical protein
VTKHQTSPPVQPMHATDAVSRPPRKLSARIASRVQTLLFATGKAVGTLQSVRPVKAWTRGWGRQLGAAARLLRLRYTPPEPWHTRGVTLYPRLDSASEWTYHDERWVRVVHRWEHRQMLREGRSLVVADNQQTPPAIVGLQDPTVIRADVPADGEERWVCVYLDPVQNQWRNFRWSFTARRDSSFREFQFAFRYVDFYNRYRFRQEDDQLHFDVVQEGVFYNSIAVVPLRMEMGRDYHFDVEVREQRFLLYVDGHLMLDEVDPLDLIRRGSIAVILWENDLETPIKAVLEKIRVEEIERGWTKPQPGRAIGANG